jgi:prophage maintenance system killer protein
LDQEPVFLAREQIVEIHHNQINKFGGVQQCPRHEGAIESAGDLYEIAGAYAGHIAESQACIDGNKRTGVKAALDFLEINGVDTNRFPECCYRGEATFSRNPARLSNAVTWLSTLSTRKRTARLAGLT